MVNGRILAFGFLSFLVFILGFLSFASAASCWLYSSSDTCTTAAGCIFKNDSWGSWCEELGCWSLNSQSSCTTTNIAGKNCTWSAGGTSYGCEKLSCWSLSGTNSSLCASNSAGLSCEWGNTCYSTGTVSGSNPPNCYQNQNQSSCSNMTGCAWGQCMEKGCWSYSSNTTCNAAKDWNGKNCTWSSSSNYCEQNGCWKYNTNSTTCDGNHGGLECQWKWNSCQDVDCWTWDFTNSTACINNSANLSCSWSGSYCQKQDCWNYNSQSSCQAKPGCNWKAYVSSGWCEQVDCFSWDSMRAGNQTLCENNDAAYGLNCLWSGNPSGNQTSGWCYKDIATASCANITSERACMDTYYCWWQFSNFNNPSLGGTCNNPGFGVGGMINTTILNDWNPGCYIFDMNSTDCNGVLGCNYTGGKCNSLGDAYGGNISLNGISCSYINSSSLCNSLPALSSCCTWQNGTCASNKLSSSCRDQMQAPPAGGSFCEDYSAYGSQQICEQIAGSPWYMPCQWNNATSKCGFKASDVFGNESQSLTKIDNKKSCGAAGGKWITENYCEGNISVPSGRCEYKFDEETNCDKACFACEIKDSSGNSVNATNAASACAGSTSGICEFDVSTRAPNGIGYCKAKDQFKKGMAGSCDSNCGDCTFKGNTNSNDTIKRPSYYCATSKANSDGGGCKWVNDNSTATGGYCINKGEKICEDACDRCKTQTTCANIGRTAIANQSGSCKWQGEASTGSCVNNVAGDVEICWDGIDNNDNNLVDCSDAGCYSDSYCGIVSGDCFGWTNNNTCITKGCEWVLDKWGSWCDFKGSQCWKYNQNTTVCNVQTNCQWSNGTGSAFCEKDWSKQENCMGLAQGACMGLNASGCNWTVDSWCSGTGNGTSWCNSGGGWCDNVNFKPKDCWRYSSTSSCNIVSGCSWKLDQYSQPHCEVNMSSSCEMNYNNGTCGASSNCIWETSTGGGGSSGWCMNKANKCGNYDSASCSSALGGICYWQSWGGGGGSCQSKCWDWNQTSSSCGIVPGCVWKAESGWCEESEMASCSNTTNMNNQANCQGTTGCRWKTSGWCDPKGGGFSSVSAASGGGVGGGMGGDCFKYDGNRTLCTNKTIVNITCGWTTNNNPMCEVDWSKDCWKYNSVAGGCNATNGCWFKNESWGNGFCTQVTDQCWNNMTLQSNPVLCAANQYCTNNSWGGCEPKCMTQNTTSCNVSVGCRMVSGWCNSGGMTEMFDNMEAGASAPIGTDICPESGKQASVDLCGFGMKDMGDSYGFGAGISDFSNASICNKEKLSSFVMGMAGGGAAPGGPGGGMSTNFGSEKTGSGNDTVIFLIYLDSDGMTTGGCVLDDNSSGVGYEFRFKYSSQWNGNTSKAVETFNAYKCEDSSWKATDIKLSAWKKKMCSDIGGPMIAIKKADLVKYPTLYDSTEDLRVYVATIGNTGNISYPTDSAGPGWTTPGSIDFEIKSAFDYGADSSKFEDILKNGFIKYEDCFNGIDDDNDGNTDCNDWNCQYSSICAGKGVAAANYTDTKAPLVTGVKIEEYPDAALIMYDTNKPTNGTLELYGYGDTQCLNRTNLIYDIGVLSANVKDYKLWHTAVVYNAGNTNISLNWPLVEGSTYNYKLKVCDSNGKCSISKCSSLRTPISESKCGYCNFVTRIKVPNGWNVAYDINKDGVYEHVQGQVCGSNAGMKTNYSAGRSVNVKVYKTDNSNYFEFLNASLTKTGLNDKVRTIDTSGAIINTSEYVGLTADTRDKIINNLHPEVCRVKIPFTGTCEKLYHCDDNGQNCTDMSTATGASLIDAANCVWDVPYCEFSTYREALSTGSSSSSSSSSSGGGGGGAGGGAIGAATYSLSEDEFNKGYTKEIVKNAKFKVSVAGAEHYVKLVDILSSSIKINVSSETQQAELKVGQETEFDVSGDAISDLSVKLVSVNLTAKKAILTVKKVVGKSSGVTGDVVKEEEKAGEVKSGETGTTGQQAPKKSIGGLVYFVLGIVIAAVVILLVVMAQRNRRKKKYGY